MTAKTRHYEFVTGALCLVASVAAAGSLALCLAGLSWIMKTVTPG